MLVNLTNDGWFWGSSELDMHLACGVFRAVECRKPLLIAANTGFSAWIDGDGRIRRQGPRRDADTLLAEVRLDPRSSWYLAHGDWPAGCLPGGLHCAWRLLGPCASRRDVFSVTQPCKGGSFIAVTQRQELLTHVPQLRTGGWIESDRRYLPDRPPPPSPSHSGVFG